MIKLSLEISEKTNEG